MRQNGARVWGPPYKKIVFIDESPEGLGPEEPQEFFRRWVGPRGPGRGLESRAPSSKKSRGTGMYGFET